MFDQKFGTFVLQLAKLLFWAATLGLGATVTSWTALGDVPTAVDFGMKFGACAIPYLALLILRTRTSSQLSRVDHDFREELLRRGLAGGVIAWATYLTTLATAEKPILFANQFWTAFLPILCITLYSYVCADLEADKTKQQMELEAEHIAEQRAKRAAAKKKSQKK